MFCYNCGKEIPENAIYCPFCGTQVNVSVTADFDTSVTDGPEADVKTDELTVVSNNESTAENRQESCEPAVREIAPNAISSFVWSLIANELCFIPILGLFFSLIAFVKSSRGRRVVDLDPERYKLKGMLTVAFILSIIDLVGSLLIPILLAIYTSFFSKIIDMSEISDMFTGFV